jgi:hypothetical protein
MVTISCELTQKNNLVLPTHIQGLYLKRRQISHFEYKLNLVNFSAFTYFIANTNFPVIQGDQIGQIFTRCRSFSVSRLLKNLKTINIFELLFPR